MKCIDVSEFQGKIDWNKVKADGVLGVIIRAGYGNNNIDERFYDNIKGAISVGMNIGIYWFSYAYDNDMATNEADCCVKLLEKYKDHITLPVFFDWEYDSRKYARKNGVDPSVNLLSTMTRAFCERIEKLGYTAGYYLNLDYSKNYYNENILMNFKRWFARYIKSEQKDCYMWQYTSDGSVDGIDGPVDMDILWGDLCKPKKDKKPEIKPTLDHDDYYVVGDTYTIDASALNVRTGPDVDYPLMGYNNLTPDGKAHATEGGALIRGTRVTCLEVIKHNEDDIWIKIPSGYVCAKCGSIRYIIK